MIGQRADGKSHVCDLADPAGVKYQGEAQREAIRDHGAQMSLPSLEESEAIIAQAETIQTNPTGQCCGG
jgi:hypothetical protein